MDKKETKREKFERIAERRTNEALKKIRLLKHLSNKNNYDYSDQHVNKIITALKKEIELLEKEFKVHSNSDDIEFKF